VEWLTTSTVLAGLQDYHNQIAWQSFAGRFRRPIVSFVRTMGLTETDAEDVAQETLIAFAEGYRKGQYDRSKGRLSKWLFGIAYRQALNQRRGNAGRAAKVAGSSDATDFLACVPDEAALSQSWDLEWERALLDECLDQVRGEFEPDTLRAFELVVQHDKSPAQAAAELGAPIKQVYNAKHRVLKRIRELRAALEDEG